MSPESGKGLVLCLPFRGDDAEKDEVTGTRVDDILDFFRRGEDDLPGFYDRDFAPDMHLSGTFENIIKLGGPV
jgi:hypothetical protein